jgi:hypothetical protein
MVVLYRTSYPPIEYRNGYFSIAFAFRVLCVMIQFFGPLAVCILAMVRQPNVHVDREMPKVTPGEVLTVSGMLWDADGTATPPLQRKTLEWPDGLTIDGVLQIETVPKIEKDVLTEWVIRLSIVGSRGQYTFEALTLTFDYRVELNRWARNSVKVLGSYSYNFARPASAVTGIGYLALEQAKVVPFQGSFENYWFADRAWGAGQKLEAQDNVSSLFYVDWEDNIPKYGPYMECNAELRIKVKPLEIMHQIPLVSSLESMLLMYLSTLLFTTIVLNWIQGLIYRNGILKTWLFHHYVPTPAVKT